MKRSHKTLIATMATIFVLAIIVFTNVMEDISLALTPGEHHSMTRASDSSFLQRQEIELKDSFANPYLRLSIDYEVSPFESGWPNLFQTADVNSGIRVEFTKTTMGLVYATTVPSAPNGVQLTSNLKFSGMQRLKIDAVDKRFIRVLESEGGYYSITSPRPSFSLDRILIGGGFNETRPFIGHIYGFSLSVYDYPAYRKILWSLYGLMAGGFLALIATLKRLPTK